MSEVYVPIELNNYNTRSSYQKLKQPLRKTNTGQKALSYIGPSLWKKLPEILKQSPNAFKHSLKKNTIFQNLFKTLYLSLILRRYR